MHCVNCGSLVQEGASYCSACGKPPSQYFVAKALKSESAEISRPATPNKPRKIVGCLVLTLGIFVLIGIVGAVSNPDKTKPDKVAERQNSVSTTTDTPASEGSASTEELPLAVKASELFNAYQNNEANAQSYFGDRKLYVTGIIQKVSLDFMDNAVVELRSPNQFMNVQATLANDAKNTANNYDSGDKAKLLCESVSEVMSIPILKDCRPAPNNIKTQAIKWRK